MKFALSVLFILSLISCQRKWTEKDRSEFMSGCLAKAMNDPAIADSSAKKYCSCLLEKVENKYPNANNVQYIKYDTSIVGLSRKCLEQAGITRSE